VGQAEVAVEPGDAPEAVLGLGLPVAIEVVVDQHEVLDRHGRELVAVGCRPSLSSYSVLSSV
jgi:hypothetical protein